MSVKDRLKKFLKERSVAISFFEKSINASNGYVNSISKGIGSDRLTTIADEYPELNIVWLLTGKGNMLIPIDHEDTKHTTININTLDLDNESDVVILIQWLSQQHKRLLQHSHFKKYVELLTLEKEATIKRAVIDELLNEKKSK